MASFNKVVLLGNLTRDIELRYAKTGTPFCTFRLAVNNKFGDREEACFVDCTAFNKTAEIASQYLQKGSQAMVEGRLKLDEWEKEGQKQSKLVVFVNRLVLLGSRDRGESRRASPTEEPRGGYSTPPDDDVPF